MSDPTRPEYLLQRERDIETINYHLELAKKRRADYEARLAEEAQAERVPSRDS